MSLAEGCHAYDVGISQPEDPPSVTLARQQGAALIAQWVAEYNNDKATYPMSNAANMFNLAYDLPTAGYTQVVNDTLTGSNAVRTQSVLEPTAEYSNNNDFF